MIVLVRSGLMALWFSWLGASAPPAQEPSKDQKQPDDLAARLIRNTVNESTSEDPMAGMMRDMSEIAKRLQVDFDPGEPTQARQRQVSEKLDEVIKAAAARRRAKSQPSPRQMADKRTMPAMKKRAPQPSDQKQAGETQARSSTEKASTSDASATRQNAKTDLPNARRPWGNLPQRDRDEVLQGAEEESLERFRPWIEQYFRALQESNR